MRKLTIALIVALVFALVASAATARPFRTVNCKNEGYPCTGSNKTETLLGTNGHDRIMAKGGNHWVYARNGCCETTNGGPGNDDLMGQEGVDWLRGERGRDYISGGKGGDYINGGSGRDHLDGDKDNDSINANDGERDRVHCGPGRDRAKADPQDQVWGCEDVVRR